MNMWNIWVFVRLAGKPKARILELQVRHSWRHVRQAIAGCIVTMGKTKKSKKSPGAGRSGHSQDTNPTLDSVMTAIPHRSKSDLTHFS